MNRSQKFPTGSNSVDPETRTVWQVTPIRASTQAEFEELSQSASSIGDAPIAETPAPANTNAPNFGFPSNGAMLERQPVTGWSPKLTTQELKAGQKGDAEPAGANTSDKKRIAELVALGYVSKTQIQMNAEFNVSGGRCEHVGRRALKKGEIRDFDCVGGQLWILPLENGHPGMRDTK